MTAMMSRRCDYCARGAAFSHSTHSRPGSHDACECHGEKLLTLLVVEGGRITDLLGNNTRLELSN